jgi:type IV pilus assembly protein PilM
MQIALKKKPPTVVGLEIEAGSLAAVELNANGAAVLNRTAVAPLAPGVIHEGEVADPERLSEALKTLFAENKLSKHVRLGIGNQSVVVRTLRLPAIEDPKELDAAVRFQAAEEMPMPMDQAVLEHQVVGGVPPTDGAPAQIDVVVVAARREMIAAFLEPLRDAGLMPFGIDLTAFGMIRAIADSVSAPQAEPGAVEDPTQESASAAAEAVLYCGLGDVTNLAVARGRSCLFARVSHAGLGPICDRLGASLGLPYEHAVQWLGYVGLERPLEELEGDPAIISAVREALEGGMVSLGDDLRLSLDYYRAVEGAVSVDRTALTGPGSTIPGLATRLEEMVGLPVLATSPHVLSGLDPVAAARLTFAYGLALES